MRVFRKDLFYKDMSAHRPSEGQAELCDGKIAVFEDGRNTGLVFIDNDKYYIVVKDWTEEV